MSNDYNTMSMLRLCSIDPPKYGWTACGGVASILEPHEMARRQEAKERFLKRQREADAANAASAAAASSAAAGSTGDGDAAANNDNAATTAASSPQYYTITEPSAEKTEPASSTATATATADSSNDKDDDKKTAVGSTTPEKNDNKKDNKKSTATPLKKISIHSTNNNTLDIYTYHRGRVGQEPRHPKTGELLCDTDPVDTNHGWIPPKMVVKVAIKFPLGDPNEEDYVDSDLDEEDDDDDVKMGNDGGEKESLIELERSESISSNSNIRASRSRNTRAGSSGGPSIPPTLNHPAATNTQQQQQQQPSKALPHFIEVIQWDVTNPQTPTPEEYAANIASEFGLTFPQTMDLKESIEKQLNDFFGRQQPQFYPPIALLDPYGSERPEAHFGPPEVHCGPVPGATAASKPSTIRRSSSTTGGSSRKSNASAAGGGGPPSSSRSARPAGAIKPDRRGINVVPPDQVQKHNLDGDLYSQEVMKRAKDRSCAMVREAVQKGEEVLEIVNNEVCHICHNRKEMGLTFHCGRHSYCDFHCASRLSFRVHDYDKNNPTCIPIDYCPVCTLYCTCAKCTRRLEDVAGKMKIECQKQNCTVHEVVMDNMFELCSSKLKGDRESKLKASSGASASNNKKKGSSKKVTIEDGSLAETAGGGGMKRGRSDEEDYAGYVPRQSTSRSTRSSPPMADEPSDTRPKKKKKAKPIVPVPVLKASPTESIERQLNDFCGRQQPQFYPPIALLDSYGSERPEHFGPPEVLLSANKPSTIRRFNSRMGGLSRKSNASAAGGGGPPYSLRSARPTCAIKPDRRGINVVPPEKVKKHNVNGDLYSQEVLKHAKARSCAMVSESLQNGDEVLEIVHNAVCHLCHNRKETGLAFHCGRHTYCDFHCASRLSFLVHDYDKKNPTCIPIDYCPVCALQCTCAKCNRRLEDAAGETKIECQKQNCPAHEVAMDNLFEMCSNKVKGYRESKPKASSSSASNTKKKGSNKKVKIEDSRSNWEDDAGYVPRPSTSRSTRSSPLMADEQPAVPVPVLKVPLSEFPKEMYGAQDLDPSVLDDLNKVFTPDGSFPVEDANTVGLQVKKQKYQQKLEMAVEGNFYQCAVCNQDNGDETFICSKCPRSYHKKCFEVSCNSGESENSDLEVYPRAPPSNPNARSNPNVGPPPSSISSAPAPPRRNRNQASAPQPPPPQQQQQQPSPQHGITLLTLPTGQTLSRSQAPGIGWPPAEDLRLTEVMCNHKSSQVNWDQLCVEHGMRRTARECHDRWTRYLKPGSRKGQWREEEDAIVLRVIFTSGAGLPGCGEGDQGPPFTQWADLAPQLPGRTGKQIRDRWVNYLNPAINHLPFSREDDLRLWSGHKELGKRWVEISVKIFHSTRSENHIKNRWYSAAFKKFIAKEFGMDAYVDAKQAQGGVVASVGSSIQHSHAAAQGSLHAQSLGRVPQVHRAGTRNGMLSLNDR